MSKVRMHAITTMKPHLYANVVSKSRMSHDCRAHDVVIPGMGPDNEVEFRKE